MKLLWFHLMPYTDLPEDFPEKHASVWVDIDKGLFDPVKAHAIYNDFLDEVEYAAEMGFDGVCFNEHHANGYGLMPSPNLMGAMVARRTQDAAICIMGASLALYNPPIRVAEEFAMLDLVSGGRLIAGMPVGSPMDTAYCYSVNPSMLRERYHEAHDLIIKAWTAEENFDWHGRHYQLANVNVWQRPIQDPHPTIWIPGGSSVETWAWCAEQDYLYSYLSYFGYKAARATMKGYWARMAELEKDRNPFRAGFLQFVGVADSREQAMELYREPAEYFYNVCLHLDARWAVAPGYQSELNTRMRTQSMVERAAAEADARRAAAAASTAAADRQAAAKKAGEATAQSASKRQTMEEIVERGYVVIGSPDEVAEQLRELAVDLNVGQLMTLCQFGNMDKDTTFYNTERFAKEVAPQLWPLFEDEWENRWWPKALPANQRRLPREKGR
ncbi:MAG: LLM class flavin-dependent oxidoreductase [Acidimicrobiia bacterium]|nr:LLM class flavin-dependent oxidoreductase [Acidimicrobiia bacterium]